MATDGNSSQIDSAQKMSPREISRRAQNAQRNSPENVRAREGRDRAEVRRGIVGRTEENIRGAGR